MGGVHAHAGHDDEAVTAQELVRAVVGGNEPTRRQPGGARHRACEAPEAVEPSQQSRGDGGAAETLEGATSVLHLRLQAVSLVAVSDELGDLDVARRHESGTAEPGAPVDPDRDGDEGVEHPPRPPVLARRPSRHEQPPHPERPLLGTDLVHSGQPLAEGPVDGRCPHRELLHVG